MNKKIYIITLIILIAFCFSVNRQKPKNEKQVDNKEEVDKKLEEILKNLKKKEATIYRQL